MDEMHLQTPETALGCLQMKDFKESLNMSLFMQDEIKFIDYLLTKGGIKQQLSKPEGMFCM